MIETIWYVSIAVACLAAIGNWRVGLFLAVTADCLRDPARKLVAEEPILITLTGSLLWLVILMVALSREWGDVKLLLSRYPRLKTCLICVLIATIPAALLSCLLYRGGWMLAGVGFASYTLPFAGIAVGYLWAQSEKEMYRLFTFYSILNGIVLVGVPLEYLGYEIEGLGGLKNMEWVRYHEDYVVDLIAGFYRSPDIMGLHAAHVIMFSVMLAIRSPGITRFGWLGLAIWAGFCVLLCGRRKMIGIPMVFAAAYLLLAMLRGSRNINAIVGGGIVSLLVAGAVSLVLFSGEEYSEYTQYASTIFTQGPERANELIVGSSIGTLQQVGILGAGLGTATQGSYYLNVQRRRSQRGWQEDGVSRLLLEFGLPGAILMLVAAGALVSVIYLGLTLVSPESSVQDLQIALFSVVIANGASFAISHQQYSGDPVSALLATIIAGAVLGSPRIFARNQKPQEAPVRRLSADDADLRETVAVSADGGA